MATQTLLEREHMQQETTMPEGANVGLLERIASTALGGVLVTRGIQKHSVTSIAGAVVGANLIYRGISGHCGLYSALGVNTAVVHKPGSDISAEAPEVRRSITIGRPADELFAIWRDPAKLARIVAHFAEVTPQTDGVTHWRARGPAKQILEWYSRYIQEEPGRSLVWQSLPGSTMAHHGEITFQKGPDETGTVVALQMKFEPPLGGIGTGLVKAFHLVPRAIAGKTLRRFKSLAETGEIPTLEHNPSGRGSSDRF